MLYSRFTIVNRSDKRWAAVPFYGGGWIVLKENRLYGIGMAWKQVSRDVVLIMESCAVVGLDSIFRIF